eukprot:CAMPEP_0113651628 /NCGR_PEP_ID=MMETSP0017_2-20120614/27530_1 /TAXON_ID=2856 /ORGANISM="Cylindrotheca closterium" /LENGTH=560 /DNA_ID=CAMNT_0000564333 /DNA_START=23 /DNA_END=1705 /DNA_ORIENTATION=+ /assembly_acc=CAM_ASM_000147
MKYHTACILAFFAASAQGFTNPSSSVASSSFSSNTNGLFVRYATSAPTETSWRDLHQFNIALDKIAEQCSSTKKPVVSKAAECEELWQTQIKRNGEILPDTISFNTVLKAWNRCCSTLSECQRLKATIPTDYKRSVNIFTPLDAAKHATTLLLEQKDPPVDVASYNIVIDTWAKSRAAEAPEAAERVLKLMLDDNDVEADTFSYNGVLDAWANSGREDGLDKIVQIYHHMEGLQKQGKDIQPTIRTVNAILNAYAKVVSTYSRVGNYQERQHDKIEEYSEEAYELFVETKEKADKTGESMWMPDVMTYTILMDIYSKCGTYKATQKAENLLKELKKKFEESKNGSLKPNFRTYTALLTAWSRTRSDESPTRVEELLDEMKANPATQPNARTYTSAIQCWGKSSDSQKAKRVLKLLLAMKESHKTTGKNDVRPTIMTYNAAIDACAKCLGSREDQTEALKISFAILKSAEADDAVEVNSMTYSMVLHAVTKLLPSGPECSQVASALFEKAKKGGYVDQSVVRNVRACVGPKNMQKLFEGYADAGGLYDFDSFPNSWKRNIR